VDRDDQVTAPIPAAEHPRGPGVRFPPLLVYVAGFGAALLLNRELAFEIDGAGVSVPQAAIGAILTAGGIALVVWAIRTLVRSHTTFRPDRPARVLVTAGPYRFTRNPIYVGLTFVYLGAASLTNLAWPLVLLPVVLIAMSVAVIGREERHLSAIFGAEYDAYCRRVHRWL
jgi:protein-S-isoprenylcysteine O-methyltransferase Ste14